MKKHVYILSLSIALIGTHIHAMKSNQEEVKKGERLYSVPRSIIENKEDSEKIKVTEKEAKNILRGKREQCKMERGEKNQKCMFELKQLKAILCGRYAKKLVVVDTISDYEEYVDGPCKGERYE